MEEVTDKNIRDPQGQALEPFCNEHCHQSNVMPTSHEVTSLSDDASDEATSSTINAATSMTSLNSSTPTLVTSRVVPTPLSSAIMPTLHEATEISADACDEATPSTISTTTTMILYDPKTLTPATKAVVPTPPSAPHTKFTLFPKLPAELRSHVRSYYLCLPQLLTLILDRPASRLKRFRSEVMYQVNQESRAQAMLYFEGIRSDGDEKDGFSTLPLQLVFSGKVPEKYEQYESELERRGKKPEEDKDFESAVLDKSVNCPGGLTSLRIDPENTIFILQGDQDHIPPDVAQEEQRDWARKCAYEKWVDFLGEDLAAAVKGTPSDFHFVWPPQWDLEEDVWQVTCNIGRDLPLPDYNIVRNIALRLSISPFIFHYGHENRISPSAQGQTQLESWADMAVDAMVDEMVRHILDWLPKVKVIYYVVQEIGTMQTHYESSWSFWYPKSPETALLPWQEAKEGTLIYDSETLKCIEKAFQKWDKFRKDVDYFKEEFKPLWADSIFPELRVVIADYAGRPK